MGFAIGIPLAIAATVITVLGYLALAAHFIGAYSQVLQGQIVNGTDTILTIGVNEMLSIATAAIVLTFVAVFLAFLYFILK